LADEQNTEFIACHHDPGFGLVFEELLTFDSSNTVQE
jgi:hypothetical protein